MPTVARRVTEIESAITPEKRRMRSDSDSSTPLRLRKSPRFSNQDSPKHSQEVEVVTKSLISSLNSCGLQQENLKYEKIMEQTTGDPREKEHLKLEAETKVVSTPGKGRLRSNSDSSTTSPLRKSPRCLNQVSHVTPRKVDIIVKSLISSLNSCGSPQDNVKCERIVERSTWDPRDKEQVRVVKEALHLSTAPTMVMCREDEQKRILDFCKECLENEKAGSLYVCGCPGTGKTLSMEKVRDALVSWAKEENISSPDILSITCTSLTNTSEIFTKILGKQHPAKKVTGSTSLKLLHNYYSQKQRPGTKMTLLIADELDYLITKDREVLHDLFMLTTLPFSRCILLGVANAIDLADRFIPKLQSLNCKPKVITFRAYSMDQIITILRERLKALPHVVFHPRALELCAKKVAGASGDMRKALSICRSAIELLEAEIKDSSTNSNMLLAEKIGDKNQPAVVSANQVSLDHVANALAKTYISSVVDTIRSLPQHPQIILCASVKLFQSGKKDTNIGELNKCYNDVCKSTSIPAVGVNELSSMCTMLAEQGILKVGQSREDKLKRVSLKVDKGDIEFALQGIRFFRNCLQ